MAKFVGSYAHLSGGGLQPGKRQAAKTGLAAWNFNELSEIFIKLPSGELT